MKRTLIIISLLILSFYFNSCGKTEDDSDNSKDTLTNSDDDENGSGDTDEDCSRLSSELPNDIITKVLSLTTEPAAIEFVEKSSTLLKDRLPDFIDFDVVNRSYKSDDLGTKIIEFDFSYNKIPFCSEHAKVYTVTDKLVLTGNLPPKDLLRVEPDSFPLITGIPMDQVSEKLEIDSSLPIERKEKCYTIKENRIIPVWKIKVLRELDPYQILVSEKEIISVKPLFFHSDANIRVYDEKDIPGNKTLVMKDYTIRDSSSGGTLCSARFRVVADDGYTIPQKEDLNFIFNPESESEFFDQASLYVYAHLQASYIESLYSVEKWYGPQIELVSDMKNDGMTNGAQYVPGDSLTKPQIRMPKGDGKKLHQIRRDNEAVQHEVGHHVLYRSVQDPTGESLVIHEGVADAFVQLRTKNACLGEQLCVNDLLCTSNDCLRSADNTYTVNSPDLPFEAHLQSQLISGLFWDIALKVGHDEVAAWLNYAIDFLPERAYFEDLVIALYNSLEQLHNNKKVTSFDTYCESLLIAYKKRGFYELAKTHGLNCTAG